MRKNHLMLQFRSKVGLRGVSCVLVEITTRYGTLFRHISAAHLFFFVALFPGTISSSTQELVEARRQISKPCWKLDRSKGLSKTGNKFKLDACFDDDSVWGQTVIKPGWRSRDKVAEAWREGAGEEFAAGSWKGRPNNVFDTPRSAAISGAWDKTMHHSFARDEGDTFT